MSAPQSSPNSQLSSQSPRNPAPRRLIVTVSVAIFAVRDWSLWVLLRDGPWGPPMRIVLGTESVTDAVERTMEALLLWPAKAPFIQMKAGWQEQQVQVWRSAEQGAAVSLIHSILLRANHDELRPNLQTHSVPSLRVAWTPVKDIEAGQRHFDPEVVPLLQTALHTLRSRVQREPEIVLQYLADMCTDQELDWPDQSAPMPQSKEAHSADILREPAVDNGILTLAEAALLYRGFFPKDEQIDLSNLRRRFLATNRLEALEEERPVRGRELDWRRVSRVYRYLVHKHERE